MIDCPDIVGNARVVLYTAIDKRHRHTGNCKQIIGGLPVGPLAGLAVCQYEGEDSYYLFGCDESWNSVTDSWHGSVEDAIDQAEFEYEGTKSTWVGEKA